RRRQKAAHAVRLPSGRLPQVGDRSSFPAPQQFEDLFGLRGSRSLSPEVFATRSTDPAGKLLGLVGFLGPRPRCAFVDLDGRKAELGDAQREWLVVLITAPDRQGTGGGNLLDQTFGEKLAHQLLGRSALQLWGKLDAAILALR